MLNRLVTTAAALGLTVLCSSLVWASDEPDELMPGTSLVAKTGKLAKFVAKGTFDVPDVPGNDPSIEGGSLRIYDTGGMGGDDTYVLPAAGWTLSSSGWRYKGAGTAADPCRSVSVKATLVKAVCKGPAVTLDPPFGSDAAIILSVGTGTKRYCATFGGRTLRNDSGTLTRKGANAPGRCGTPCVLPVPGDNTPQLQAILDAGSDLVLCPGQTYPVASTLFFRAAGQQIYTADLPTSQAEQARLEWASAEGSEMVVGAGVPSIRLHHVTIDGMRRQFGHEPNFATSGVVSGAMVDFAGAAGAYVGYNHLTDPRGWSALHVFFVCNGTTIEHNEIGPAGHADGTWADGISYDCQFGEVSNNVITDATDGAIVVFGGAGSRIHDNTIQAVTRRLLGGINMVDPGFNYTGTEVYRNTIRSDGTRIKVGIAMGPMVWGFSCGGLALNDGAMVYQNHLEGEDFGYGYVLNGVSNWVFSDNTASGTFGGSPQGCRGNLAPPRAFACQLETVNGGSCPVGTDVVTSPLNLDGVIHPATQD